jgi:nitrite reductase/ring-hydroxylating ferredoxin subunit
MQGRCKSCPSSSLTLKLAIEEAIYAAAPDVLSIEAEGVREHPAATGFVQIGKSPGNGKTNGKGKANDNGNGSHGHDSKGNGTGDAWEEVFELSSLTSSNVRLQEVRGRPILFCRLGESFYAYANNCPGCGSALQDGQLELTNLVCPHCRQQYDVIRAGRGLDQPDLHLEPFPLLFDQGRAKVALPTQ